MAEETFGGVKNPFVASEPERRPSDYGSGQNLLHAIRGGVMSGNEYRVLNTPGARVIKTTASNVPQGNTTWGITSNAAYATGVLSGGWNAITYDNDGMVNLTLDDSAITCVTPGIYLVGGSFDFNTGGRSDGRRLMDINRYRKGNATRFSAALTFPDVCVCRDEKPSDDANFVTLTCSGPIQMNAGDTIGMRLYQTNGVAAVLGCSGASTAFIMETTMFAQLMSTL